MSAWLAPLLWLARTNEPLSFEPSQSITHTLSLCAGVDNGRDKQDTRTLRIRPLTYLTAVVHPTLSRIDVLPFARNIASQHSLRYSKRNQSQRWTHPASPCRSGIPDTGESRSPSPLFELQYQTPLWSIFVWPGQARPGRWSMADRTLG
ncbi:hypothetical protein LX32DRAFT_348023 [Colletotrichum zoysiae]|uniref:Uncharacterized protein n=1 Tax=Colletotrichum zoysiae TaxID=1216348 RepID=A0AAD9HL43_9PEZI|nr:hypothetical protein LX32DRAFT_348023 [Colletotrichum zoysiae]